VRKVTPRGTITTYAGSDGVSVGDGGPATSARLSSPVGLALDRQGNVYIAEHNGARVRKVSAAGTITTVAGTGVRGGSGDGGPATSARLYAPRGVTVDAQGNLYVSDWELHTVRRVSPSGTITTFAGTGRPGFSGDGGAATQAQLSHPEGIAVDGQGNVFIVDSGNGRVRKVSPAGTITTIAGGGTGATLGDGGAATSARLSNPGGLVLDAEGSLYVADWGNYRVRKISGGTITTDAGNGECGPFTTGAPIGDGGPAPSAPLCWPWGLALDAQGNLYVSEQGRSRVRRIAKPQPAAPRLTLSAAPLQNALARHGIRVTAKCDDACGLSATGSVKIVGTRSTFTLARATASLSRAGSRKLTLRWSVATQKRFRKLRKPGRRAQAVTTVRATGATGLVATAKITVAVR
jgi:sugar lactone lactonase YvrE